MRRRPRRARRHRLDITLAHPVKVSIGVITSSAGWVLTATIVERFQSAQSTIDLILRIKRKQSTAR